MHSRGPFWPLILVLAEATAVTAQPQPKAPAGPADQASTRTGGRAGDPPGGADPRKPIEVPTGHPGTVYGLAFSPDGKELATTCSRGDPRVRFWDPRTGQLIRSLEAHPAGAWAIAYTPDGTRLVTASFMDKEDVCVWDARTHKKLVGMKGHKHGALVLAISPDGKRLVSVGKYTAVDDVSVWDLETGKLQLTHPKLANSVQRAAFLPDGRTLLVNEIQRLRVWDVGPAAGDGVRDLGDLRPSDGAGRKSEYQPIFAAEVGLGGRVFAMRGADRTTRLLEVITGEELCHIKAGFQGLGLAFAPDGRTIVRTGGVGLEVLDWPSERVILNLRGHTQPVYKLALSPDGKRLASVGAVPEAMTVFLWDLSDVVGRPLPKVEAKPKDLDQWCKDLAGNDARTAYRAIWGLAAAPDQAIVRLKAMIGDKLRTTPADIDRWIADLDHDRFAAREAATVRLTEAGTTAVARMEAALKDTKSPEQKRRLQAIVAAIREAPVPPDRLFAVRIQVVLEQIGTPEARKLLEEWAKAVAKTQQAVEGRAVAERLAKRQTLPR
jgi:WD40 repeat protein